MNKVLLIGRITKDPEIKQTTNTRIINFNLAVERDFKSDNGEKQADFISCVAYNYQADFISRYVKKGDKISIEGRITTGSYKRADSSTVYTVDVTVEKVEQLTPRQQTQQPQQQKVQQPQPYTPPYNSTPQYSNNEMVDITDDLLPF